MAGRYGGFKKPSTGKVQGLDHKKSRAFVGRGESDRAEVTAGQRRIAAAPMAAKYGTVVDRESAYERLRAKAAAIRIF